MLLNKLNSAVIIWGYSFEAYLPPALENSTYFTSNVILFQTNVFGKYINKTTLTNYFTIFLCD